MFRVASHCVVSWHQFTMGKDLGRPAMPARKCFFRCGLHLPPDLCDVCLVVYTGGESVGIR